MRKYRTFAIAAAAILIVLHAMVLATYYGSKTASLWGDWINTAAPLVAAIVCWVVSCHSGPFGKRVWRLISFSASLNFVSQVLYTYYSDYLHAHFGTLWPSDIMGFFWTVPALMTLFLSPRDPDRGFRWLRFFDFVQVCTLVLTLELSLLFVPSRWRAAGQAMDLRAVRVSMVFFSLLFLSFLLRGLLTPNRTAKAFFLRMALFLFVYDLILNTTIFAQATSGYHPGTWRELVWTLAYCLLIGIAATWNEVEQQATAVDSVSR